MTKYVNIKNKTMIKLCYLTALKDRQGNVLKDDKGRVTSLSGFTTINIKVIPNPNSDGDLFDYVLCVGSSTGGVLDFDEPYVYREEIYNESK